MEKQYLIATCRNKKYIATCRDIWVAYGRHVWRLPDLVIEICLAILPFALQLAWNSNGVCSYFKILSPSNSIPYLRKATGK